MKFDRNIVLGSLVLGALFIGFFYFTNKDQRALQKQRQIEKAKEDSIAKANLGKVDTAQAKQQAVYNDSVRNIVNAGKFQTAKANDEQLVYAENDVFKIAFTTKGG